MSALSPAIQRMLALGLAGFVLLCSWSFVASPLLQSARDYDAARAALETSLRGKQALAARLPALEAKRAALQNSPTLSQTLFHEASAPVAGAVLQNQMRSILMLANAEIVSVENLSPSPKQTLTRLGTRLVFRGDEAALEKILIAIEGSAPQLYVERLSINTNAAGIKSDTTRHLTMTLEVFGYWKAPA